MTFEEEFDKLVSPLLSSCPCIDFTDDEIARITEWAEKKSEYKLASKEEHHIADGSKEVKRNITGQMGEWAVEKYLDISFVDWTIGDSVNYAHPDIGIKNVGVKTVEYGKFPVIFVNSYYPEIICVKKGNSVYILGLAETAVLNKYLDSKYILDAALAGRGSKTCFTGFDKLKPISLYKGKRGGAAETERGPSPLDAPTFDEMLALLAAMRPK